MSKLNEKITITVKEKDNNSIKMELDARRTLDGHILIADHDYIDIVLTADRKLTIYPKKEMNDSVEYAQDSLIKYMINKGAVDRGTIEGTHIYGGVEVKIPESKEINSTQAALLLIGKWILEEKPKIEMEKYDKKRGEIRITNPDDENSTELGEVPHAAKKGSLGTGQDLIKRYLAGFQE